GGRRFNDHIGGALPSVVAFEAGDLVNWGASNADLNRNFVSGALGFRIRATESIDLGFAWEMPLTDVNQGLMEDRFTVDMVIRFWSFTLHLGRFASPRKRPPARGRFMCTIESASGGHAGSDADAVNRGSGTP